jgi:hypothetical protein
MMQTIVGKGCGALKAAGSHPSLRTLDRTKTAEGQPSSSLFFYSNHDSSVPLGIRVFIAEHATEIVDDVMDQHLAAQLILSSI